MSLRNIISFYLPFAYLFSLNSPKVSMIIPNKMFNIIIIIIISNDKSKKNLPTYELDSS